MKTLLDSLVTAEVSLAISDTIGTMFDSQDVYIAFYRYVTFDYACRMDQTVNDFTDTWRSYIKVRLHDIRRMYDALHAGYDPISNYDMVERSADARSYGKETDTVTPSGSTTETSTTTGSETTTYKRQGADSTGFEDYDQTTVNSPVSDPRTTSTTTSYNLAKSETTREHTHDKSATVDGTTLTGADVNDHILTRKGNIGVTTAQQMIDSELKLRQFQLLANIISGFIKEACFLSWGVGDD